MNLVRLGRWSLVPLLLGLSACSLAVQSLVDKDSFNQEPAYRYTSDPQERQLLLTRADKALVGQQFQQMRENFLLLLERVPQELAQEQAYLLKNPELKGLKFEELVYGLPEKYQPLEDFHPFALSFLAMPVLLEGEQDTWFWDLLPAQQRQALQLWEAERTEKYCPF